MMMTTAGEGKSSKALEAELGNVQYVLAVWKLEAYSSRGGNDDPYRVRAKSGSGGR
jgi:hypothetical protein